MIQFRSMKQEMFVGSLREESILVLLLKLYGRILVIILIGGVCECEA